MIYRRFMTCCYERALNLPKFQCWLVSLFKTNKHRNLERLGCPLREHFAVNKFIKPPKYMIICFTKCERCSNDTCSRILLILI